MNAATRLLLVLGLGLIGWLLAHARTARQAAPGARTRTLPAHAGWYVALGTAGPALAFLAVWAVTAPALVTDGVLHHAAAAPLPPAGFERATILAEARSLADGRAHAAFHPLAAILAPIYATVQQRFDVAATLGALLLAGAGGLIAFLRLSPALPARARLERLVEMALLAAASIALVTTFGIVASLLAESARFFALVPPLDFLFGTHWSPQAIDPADPGATLGAVPLFWGSFFIGAVIAMLVAVPFGLMSAIYLTQYARPVTRRWVKPWLEMLAGVPTVVYGYLAALVVAPAVRDWGIALGIPDASGESALAAGLVIGVMIIPFVSSTADDSLSAVPGELRDASLALGATSAETVRRVLVPAALPGIVGGVLLAISRAVGETMIVVMAASAVATLTVNPFASTTAVTRQIVDLLTGEAAFDDAKTLAAFALGLTLFAITLLLNLVALAVVKRYRNAYA